MKKGISFQNIRENDLIVLPLFDHPCLSSFLLILVSIYLQDEWDSKLKSSNTILSAFPWLIGTQK